MPLIRNLVEKYEGQYHQQLNLVASENLSSNDVRYALSSDLHHRYAIPPEGERPKELWDYPNQTIIRNIIAEAESLACDIYGASSANLCPLSGNQIAQIILMNFLKKGDTFMSVGGNCGGHFTTEKVSQRVGLNRIDLPYNYQTGTIDIDRAASLIKKEKPRLIFLDASMILFPYPVSQLREVCGDDVVISYDGSHTLGLIGGGEFQDPLNEGADLLHGSTHKSLWGPQKGMILGKTTEDKANQAYLDIIPFFVSNAHTHHIAALGIALEEVKEFGKAYAKQVILNAKTLAKNMHNSGLDVAFPDLGFTNCHQVIVKIGSKSEAQQCFIKLQEVGINTNAIRVPFSLNDEYGLRIGLSELTRRRFKEEAITEIAHIISGTVLGKSSEEITKSKVQSISKEHDGLDFSFDAPTFENKRIGEIGYKSTTKNIVVTT